MKIENVKAIFKDKDNMYLVGLSSYPSPNIAYSLLGGHSEKGETPFETLGRELMEESSTVLELGYDEIKGFHLKDYAHHKFDLQFDGITAIDKKWYVFFILNESLHTYLSSWKTQFQKNQIKIKNDAAEALKEIDQHLNWHHILDLFLKRKFVDAKKELSVRLTKSEIQQVIAYIKDIGYYLENKDLVLVDLLDLKQKLYEKDILHLIS